MNLIKLFLTDTRLGVSAKEIAALDAIRSTGNHGGCCADLQEKILESTGKEPRIATLYGILTELERKGLVEPFASVPHENGGRPRQMYRLTESGRRAIALGEAMVSSRGHPQPA